MTERSSPLRRKTWCALSSIGLLVLASGAPQCVEGADIIGELEDRAAFAVGRGLEFLKATQAEDGSWAERIGQKVQESYRGEINKHVGVTALACMAFMANGSMPGRGKYSAQVEKGLRFVLENVQENGFISAHGTRMYSHAFATLFLAEVYGMTGSAKVRDKLKLAVKLIVDAQNDQGGWRYKPASKDADISVTVCQVMALRGASNAGIHVPEATRDLAIDYVKNSFSVSNGGFNYQISEKKGQFVPTRCTFALTAAGVTALYGAGEYTGEYIDSGLRYLRQEIPPAEDARRTFDYFYGMYYATQAAFQRGGSYWDEWQRRIWRDILGEQDKEHGYWQDQVGKHYATAMACVILQIPYQYLPVFER